ncbi:MAG: hypothetical protein Q7T05_05605 [Dehalococcoidia bacterium]|nr:hypothetical protein [Dehalococcoidia bacterium]
MSDAVTIVLAMLLMLFLLFVIPQFLIKRAVPAVLRVFRERNATTQGNAMTAEELGLAPLSFARRMFKRRDYKPAALNALITAGIVRSTAEGKLYLEEARLAATPFAKR